MDKELRIANANDAKAISDSKVRKVEEILYTIQSSAEHTRSITIENFTDQLMVEIGKLGFKVYVHRDPFNNQARLIVEW